jgi:general secretion pathway protein G
MKPASRSRVLKGAVFFALIFFLTVAALALIVWPGASYRPRREYAELELRNLHSSLQLYKERMGRYPTTAEGLKMLVDPGILTSLPKDPWANDYVYAIENGKLTLMTFGRDGARGGAGPDEDLALEIGSASE